jgi:hypothetical protein
MCLASHMQASACVGEKHGVVGGEFAQRCRQEFRADGLEQIALPRVSLYETNLRSVATLIVSVYEQHGSRRSVLLLGIASVK